MLPPRVFFFHLFLAFSLFLSSSALDTAVYSSRDRDATAAGLAAAMGAGTTAAPPLLPETTTTLPPPPPTPPGNGSSFPVSPSAAFSSPHPVLLGRYDPCSEPGPATKGRALYLGLALWPGGDQQAWGPASSLLTKKGADEDFDDASLNPCRLSPRSDPQSGATLPSAAATLAAAGVLIVPFAVRIDSVAALRVGGALQRRALELAAVAAEAAVAKESGGGGGNGNSSSSSSISPVVTAVLFRGTKVRSEARIVSSADPGVSFGAGFVQALAAEIYFGKKITSQGRKEKKDFRLYFRVGEAQKKTSHLKLKTLFLRPNPSNSTKNKKTQKTASCRG